MSDLSSTLRRSIPSLESFLKDISPQDPIGPSLRYDALYDTVRLNRQEDDPRLSMGIWQTDLKRADWVKIEDLCMDALLTKSKDLQIALWLTEAWTALDGLDGYTRGVQVLSGLCETFWQNIHPQLQNEDLETRALLFEWMDSALSTRLLLLPITHSTHDESSFGIGYYKSAQHSDTLIKRSQNTKTTVKIDPSKSVGTVEIFQKSLNQTRKADLETVEKNIEPALQVTETLKKQLTPLLNKSSPSFSQILNTLKEMERILKSALQSRIPIPEVQAVEPVDDVQPELPQQISQAQPGLALQTRNDAYRQLENVATFLEQNDPQSLAPKILRQVISWENKNIIDVLREIAKTPEEYEILMRLLGNPF